MVHACRIKGGKASYSNRLVQTHRLKREVKQGFPLYLRVCPSQHPPIVSRIQCDTTVALYLGMDCLLHEGMSHCNSYLQPWSPTCSGYISMRRSRNHILM